jgi:hypothetical protein
MKSLSKRRGNRAESVKRAGRKRKIIDKHRRQLSEVHEESNNVISVEMSPYTTAKKLPERVDSAPTEGTWTSYHDMESNRMYYVNEETGRTTWTPHEAIYNTNETSEGDKKIVYSNGWSRRFNPSTGDAYYEHTETGKTQWHKPEETNFDLYDVGSGADKYYANPLQANNKEYRPRDNSCKAITTKNDGDADDNDMQLWDGKSRRSVNAWNEHACGKYRRCCCRQPIPKSRSKNYSRRRGNNDFFGDFPGICGCCPLWCVWPCCAQRLSIRISSVLCTVFTIISLICWIAMGLQLLSLLKCVQNDTCFNIEQIHVVDITTPKFLINVRRSFFYNLKYVFTTHSLSIYLSIYLSISLSLSISLYLSLCLFDRFMLN